MIDVLDVGLLGVCSAKVEKAAVVGGGSSECPDFTCVIESIAWKRRLLNEQITKFFFRRFRMASKLRGTDSRLTFSLATSVLT